MARIAFIQKTSFEKMSVHYLAGALRANNIEYQLFIEELEKDFYGELVKYNPSYVIYSLYIGEEDFAFEHFRKIKKLMPHVKTLAGGLFCLIFPEIYRREEVDYVFRGDGEFTLPEFIKLMEAGKSTEGIDGICFIDEEGREHRNDNIPLVDVREIPRPDRDLYYKYDTLRANNTKDFIASRGCPYGCTYCYNRELFKFFQTPYWRQGDIDSVIEEIRYVKDKYDFEWVHFQDGTFNADKNWLREFLETYSRAALPQFLCNARIENIDEEIVRLLKKAGCNRITFGIQSGNTKIRCELAGRPMTNEQIVEGCKLCKKYGIRVGVDIIFGWPGETLKEAMDTIALCRQIDVDTYHSNVLIFYPQTHITRYAYENNCIEKNPSLEDMSYLNPNKSPLVDKRKKLLINMDKLFYYLIKYPILERPILCLIKLPPNKIFYLLKNVHLLVRSLKYDNTPTKFRIILNYITSGWKAVG